VPKKPAQLHPSIHFDITPISERRQMIDTGLVLRGAGKNYLRSKIEVRPTALLRPRTVGLRRCRWTRPHHASRLAALVRGR